MKRRKPMKPPTKPLARRTPMKCGKPLVNQAPLKRTGPLKPRNNQRANAKRVRNFGEPGGEADIVRNMECACVARLREAWMLGKADPNMACDGPVDPAHAVARGGGGVKGDRWRILALCRKHHEEAGEADRPGQVGETKRSRFIARYGFDPIVVADDIAVGHPRPLGIRGLADRWASNARADDDDYDDCPVCDGEAVPREAIAEHNAECDAFQHDVLDGGGGRCTDCGAMLPACPSCSDYKPGRQRPLDPLADHETDALHGWVRREADRETERRYRLCRNCFGDGRDGEPSMGGRDPGCIGPCECFGGSGYTSDRRALEWFDDHGLTPPDDPDALAEHIATRLGGVFDQGDRSLARALLDAAVQR